MDSLWQRHKTFIVEILAGLVVCLLLWIVGSSLTGVSLDVLAARIQSKKTEIRSQRVHSRADTQAFREASDAIRKRILFLAQHSAEMRSGEDLRSGLIGDVLALVGENSPAAREEALKVSKISAASCLSSLEDTAVKALRDEAAPKNISFDDSLGFGKINVEESTIDRYLLTLKLVVRAVKLGIEEGVYDIPSVKILPPPGSRFEGKNTFLREYPVEVEYRGPSAVLLRVMDRMNEPDHLIPIRALHQFQKDRTARNDDTLVMDIEIMALEVEPEADLQEGRR